MHNKLQEIKTDYTGEREPHTKGKPVKQDAADVPHVNQLQIIKDKQAEHNT